MPNRFLLLALSLIALVVVALPCGASQSAESASSMTPASGEVHRDGGFSPEGIKAIQDMMDQAVADRRTTAVIAMLARDSEIVWLGTSGEMAPGVPMRSDAILPLASVGKMFTATAAMILYERGVIALDDPVSKYIPEFADVGIQVTNEAGQTKLVTPDRPITIFHLLTHTGGLTVDGNDFWAAWDTHVGKTTTTHFARELAAMPLQAQPGDHFEYGQTGASYEVLGAVIEISSGQTLEEFMLENIFVPLGLEDTCFYLPPEKSDRLPEVYRNVDGELQLDRALGEDFSRSTFFHGGGGVRSAPADIQKFGRLFLDGGSVDGIRILKAGTVAMMMSDQLGDKAPERWKPRNLSWGFGAAVEFSPEDTEAGIAGQYGWVGGGFAKVWIDPGERLIAYINFPLTPPGDNELLREFEKLVYATMSSSP